MASRRSILVVSNREPYIHMRKGDTIEELIHPIAGFLVPVFFVLMGVRVDLSSFGQVAVLGFASARGRNERGKPCSTPLSHDLVQAAERERRGAREGFGGC